MIDSIMLTAYSPGRTENMTKGFESSSSVALMLDIKVLPTGASYKSKHIAYCVNRCGYIDNTEIKIVLWMSFTS